MNALSLIHPCIQQNSEAVNVLRESKGLQAFAKKLDLRTTSFGMEAKVFVLGRQGRKQLYPFYSYLRSYPIQKPPTMVGCDEMRKWLPLSPLHSAGPFL